ncbi:DUF7683 domain-containing protein [Neisseria zalophi]|uniref:DUF7683 domain-containing protein n=1 Tax=Neisseria zalophi TaxID=640030 RepID=A0A5J6PZ74_9NEIS|nr:hypothetical protein [Neisseria zalophi]QEY26010.1 hypothetical protein D0T92_05330 [Neisseria zalophi]
MKKSIRFISKYEKNGELFIGVLNFKNQPSLGFLQKIFNETGLMYYEYWITEEIAEKIKGCVDGELEINNYAYFLSCEADILN